jgi:hypothetical protein
MLQNSAIFFELTSFFLHFVVEILATVAKTFTKIEKTESKAFEKARSGLEVGGFQNLYFVVNRGNVTKFCHFLTYQFLFAFLLSKSWQQSQKHSRKKKRTSARLLIRSAALWR